METPVPLTDSHPPQHTPHSEPGTLVSEIERHLLPDSSVSAACDAVSDGTWEPGKASMHAAGLPGQPAKLRPWDMSAMSGQSFGSHNMVSDDTGMVGGGQEC